MPPQLPHRPCPHCEYELDGLPSATARCPECGGSLANSAYALAAAKRIAKSHTARIVLWASPGVGIFAAIGAYLLRRAMYDSALAMFLCLSAGGTIAVYFSAKQSSRRNLGNAILIGVPLGIVYFVFVVLIAVGIVFALKFMLD